MRDFRERAIEWMWSKSDFKHRINEYSSIPCFDSLSQFKLKHFWNVNGIDLSNRLSPLIHGKLRLLLRALKQTAKQLVVLSVVTSPCNTLAILKAASTQTQNHSNLPVLCINMRYLLVNAFAINWNNEDFMAGKTCNRMFHTNIDEADSLSMFKAFEQDLQLWS